MEESTKKGKVIAVCSAKGGVGQTMIAANLSVALHMRYLSSVLVDGKLQFGDIAVAMDLRSPSTMKDVAENFGRIDQSTITDYLNEHESGIFVLPAPERLEYSELVTNEIFLKTISILQSQYDYIVIDCGYAFHEMTLDLLELAEEVLVVTTLDMISLKNTKQLIDTFRLLKLNEKMRVILNRYNMESLIKAEDVPAMMGVSEVHYITNNFKAVSQSLNIGIPILSRRGSTDVAKDIYRLVQLITADDPIGSSPKKKKRKWFTLKRGV